MTNKNSKKLGFSLIELSIVILIIGILVAGVTQGSRLVGRSRLTAAKSLTQSSPVTGIKDLSTWFETTLDKSFITAEATDATPVTIWHDIQDVANKTDAVAVVGGTAVTYRENSINGLPTIRFASGASSYFTINGNGSFMSNTPYTAFYVVRMTTAPANSSTPRPLLASSGTAVSTATVGSSTFFNYVSATTYNICESNTTAANCSTTSYTFGAPTPQIISVVNADTATSGTFIRTIFLNGNNTAINAAAGQATSTPSMTDLTIGKNNTGYFVGDIGEIIVFTRALTTSERDSVECYLGKKWGIPGPTCS